MTPTRIIQVIAGEGLAPIRQNPLEPAPGQVVLHLVRGQVGQPEPGQGGAIVNTSSGAGVIGLTKATALDDAARNIRVNAICPGIVDTPMMPRFTGGTPNGVARVVAQEPVGRMGRPEEIAAAVLYLRSETAAFVVGHALVVNGGQAV